MHRAEKWLCNVFQLTKCFKYQTGNITQSFNTFQCIIHYMPLLVISEQLEKLHKVQWMAQSRQSNNIAEKIPPCLLLSRENLLALYKFDFVNPHSFVARLTRFPDFQMSLSLSLFLFLFFSLCKCAIARPTFQKMDAVLDFYPF